MQKNIKIFMLLLLICFTLTGCSLLPRLSFDTPNTVPQSVDRSKAKEMCKGKAEWDKSGQMVSCSSGYYKYAEGYNKQERKMTIVERIKSFINSLMGWGFWGLLLLVILVPGLAGGFIGRLIEGTIGIAKKSLDATIRGVQKARKSDKDLNDSLSAEQDENVKKYIRKIKDEQNIK